MNYFSIDDRAALVRDFQEMLRAVAYDSGERDLLVAADGSYDAGTADAVRAFQRAYGLPVTGEVDRRTHEKMRSVWETYRRRRGCSVPIRPFPDGGNRTVSRGERSDLVLIIQIILSSLRLYEEFSVRIPLSGVYDAPTASAVLHFQQVNGLEATGVVDLVTWGRMAEEYNRAVRDSQ